MLQLSSTDGIRAEEDKTTSKVVLSWAEGASATLRFASVFGKLHQREGDFQKNHNWQLQCWWKRWVAASIRHADVDRHCFPVKTRRPCLRPCPRAPPLTPSATSPRSRSTSTWVPVVVDGGPKADVALSHTLPLNELPQYYAKLSQQAVSLQTFIPLQFVSLRVLIPPPALLHRTC